MKTYQFTMLPGEVWWGGAVSSGHLMPLTNESHIILNPDKGRENDQFAPFFLSSSGRYIWSDRPFLFETDCGNIKCTGIGEVILSEGHGDLRGAYLAGSKEHFPFDQSLPDERFFTKPQYNTWIELKTDQTSDGILRYARDILEHGLPAGILMIDGGWQEDYGTFEFNKRKIPDPAQLIYELHQMGFAVMVWVSPIVASAGTQFKMLRDKGYLIRNKDGEIAIRSWWSGYSAVLDLSNPEAADWYNGELHSLMDRYHVDGFKFDAGDVYFYDDEDQTAVQMPAREQTAVFNAIGKRYALNEFRAAWKFGGQPIVARLHDKYHSWNSFGINTLIPHTVLQGLLGYAYCCPDMVGGGIANDFGTGKALDEELFVRWAQANVYMGMMQMSVSPWRVLSRENEALVIDALKKHEELGKMLYAMAKETSRSGEPLTRHMAYVFPEEHLEQINTQYMLGNDLLVAPVLEKGATIKKVYLPKGTWADGNGKEYEGGRWLDVPVTLKDLPVFTRH